MSYRIFSLFTLVLFSSFYLLFSVALAFESSSASFEIHAGDAESITGSSTSATFQQSLGAGGQNATGEGTGTTKKVQSGILYWLRGFFIAQYTQIHFRWRDDNGGQGCPTTCGSGATMAASEDAQLINVSAWSVKHLRFLVSNEGWTRGAAPTFQLEVAKTATCSGGSYSAIPAGTDYSGHWHIATSTNITDAEATTNIFDGGGSVSALTDENYAFVAGEVRDLQNTTSAITLESDKFTEIEFSVEATNNATADPPYCFRVTNSGATSGTGYGFVYSQYATADISSGLTPTGDLISAVFDTTGSSDGPAYNSIMWKGTAGTGKARFQLATSDSSSGPWTYRGGASCNDTTWYDAPTADLPVEITCANDYHNDDRYFKYKIQICSNTDCSTSGVTSPVVTDVVVNWAP